MTLQIFELQRFICNIFNKVTIKRACQNIMTKLPILQKVVA